MTNPESRVIGKIDALELGGFAGIADLVDWQINASPAAISEKGTGRAIPLSWALHHINGVFADNRLENLVWVERRETR